MDDVIPTVMLPAILVWYLEAASATGCCSRVLLNPNQPFPGAISVQAGPRACKYRFCDCHLVDGVP